MLINDLDFTELEKRLANQSKSLLDYLAPEVGKVYIVTITRDGCPACERQKPRMAGLAESTAEKHGKKVVFIRIRIKHPTGKDQESLRSKDAFGHYFYPTNLILVRTGDRGAIEYYRNVSPRISEFKRSIETAVKIAGMLEEDMA